MRKILLAILLAVSISSFADEYMFKHLEARNGLSNNQINSIFKDKKGYVWFSTASGLNRFDGDNVKIFRSLKVEEAPLWSNVVENVQEDMEGYLWIKTSKGYVIYDPVHQTFKENIKKWTWNRGIEDVPSMVYIAPNKNMLMYTSGKGMTLYKPEVKLVYSLDVRKGSMPKSELANMVLCNDEFILIFKDGTIVGIDADNAAFKWRNDIIAKTVKKDNCNYKLFADEDGDVWIYGTEGFWIYSQQKRILRNNIKKLVLPYLKSACVQSISQDNKHNIWIGGSHGITLFNKRTSVLTHIYNVQGDERSLQCDNVTSAFFDNDGTMWIGTSGKGVSFYNEAAFKFGFKGFGNIRCIEEDASGNIWLGTSDYGLIEWNRKNDSVQMFSKNDKPIPSDKISCILKSRDNTLWIGTLDGGVSNLKNGTSTSYKSSDTNKESLISNCVLSLAQDVKGRIWVGTSAGLQCLDTKRNIFVTYDGLSSDYVSSLFVSGNELIVGTSNGISILNIDKREVLNLGGTKSGKVFFSDRNVNQVIKDSRGLIWIATENGLNIYNPQNDALKILSVNDGLSDSMVHGVAEDENGNIWATTPCGMTKITLQLNDKSGVYSYMLVGYDNYDGLQNSDFNLRSIKCLNNGEIIAGGLYGVNYFNPQKIRYNKIAPNVLFTDLYLFNKKVDIGTVYGSGVLLDKSLDYVKEITLEHGQNVFSVYVTSDNSVIPEKTKYIYKMVGLNDDWLISETGILSFTNLSSGRYELKVKAVNNDGMVGKEASIMFNVLPPAWLSTWAFISYFIIVIVIIALIYFIISKNNKKIINDSIKNIEREKTKQLNDMKTKFYLNASHELRTPLTLIITPLDALIKDYENEEALSSRLRSIRDNSVKLLDKMNQLMDFRKIEDNSLQLKLSDADIISFIRNIVTRYKEVAIKKEISISFFTNIVSLNMSFDEEKIEKIMTNLLSNAVKFTPERGRIDVNVSLDYNDAFIEMLEIKVSDTGIGIKDEDKDRIFERFYQVDNSEMEQSGSGMGLSLVKDFVDMFRGTINVYNNIPCGSVFVVNIPVKRAALNVKENKAVNTDGEIRAMESTDNDTSYIHTIQEIKASLAAKMGGEDRQQAECEQEMNDMGIETVSSIKAQKATVIQITEDGDDYITHVIPSDEIPEYDFSSDRRKRDDREISDIAKDMLMDKNGKMKRKIEDKPKVLVVDDDIDFLQYMQETLSVEYNVALVNDGNKAWNFIKENKPDIIICNMILPDMEGNKLCSLVKTNRLTSHIPFIVMTQSDVHVAVAEGQPDVADEYISRPFNIEIVMIRMKKLIESRYNKSHDYIAPSSNNITSMDEKLIDKAIRYIEDNLSRSDLSVEEVSKEMGMSRVHLYKRLVAITGKTPIEFIRTIRLRRAAQLLRESQQNVSEIAFQVGFNNPKYFTKYFKDEYGELPSVYQEKQRE